MRWLRFPSPPDTSAVLRDVHIAAAVPGKGTGSTPRGSPSPGVCSWQAWPCPESCPWFPGCDQLLSLTPWSFWAVCAVPCGGRGRVDAEQTEPLVRRGRWEHPQSATKAQGVPRPPGVRSVTGCGAETSPQRPRPSLRRGPHQQSPARRPGLASAGSQGWRPLSSAPRTSLPHPGAAHSLQELCPQAARPPTQIMGAKPSCWAAMPHTAPPPGITCNPCSTKTM